MDLDAETKSGWFKKIKKELKYIDLYADRIVEQCCECLRGARFMDGNYMMTKHLAVLLIRELLRKVASLPLMILK